MRVTCLDKKNHLPVDGIVFHSNNVVHSLLNFTRALVMNSVLRDTLWGYFLPGSVVQLGV